MEELRYGAVTVLKPENGGRYPHGNSFVVRGSGGSLLVDPSIGLLGALPTVDGVVLSHAHEDHMAGIGEIAAPVHAHDDDVAVVRSFDALVDAYGLLPDAAEELRHSLADEFRVAERPDARGVGDGHRFDLGDRTVTVVHLPGHTPGHCGLLVEPDGFLYVGDIDLTSFGPFYGDLGSSLDDFERSVRRCAEIEARWYGTFHQKGVVEGAAEFRARLAAYWGVAADREARLLALLGEPRSLAEIAAHRLVYRPHVQASYVPSVEHRTAELHVARLLREGRAEEVEPGRFRAT